MSERLTCIATEHRVIRGDRRPLPCGRPACAMRDGRPYCRDHDPDAGVLRAGRRRRRTRRALERELEALRAQRSIDVDTFLAAMDRLRAAERRVRLQQTALDASRLRCEEALQDAASWRRVAEGVRRIDGSSRVDNRTLELLVARFLETAPFAAWRHHGIGVLQAYVAEQTEPEVRIHVWHPDLVRPGIRESGSIHDHRFDLVSSVLVGKIRERVFETTPDDDGDWQTWHVENARSAGVERGFDGDCSPLGATMRAKILERIHYPGDQYTLARHVFHETRVDELAVTLCTMRSKRGPARLLVPRGREPVHAFGAPASDAVIRRVLAEAHEELVR